MPDAWWLLDRWTAYLGAVPKSPDPDGGPTAPAVHVIVREDGTGEVAVGDVCYPIAEPTLQDARRAATEIALKEAAQKFGAPVQVSATDPEGQHTLIVHPDGSVSVGDPVPSDRQGAAAAAVPPLATAAPPWSADASTSAAVETAVVATETPAIASEMAAAQPAEAALSPMPMAPGRHARRSFIATEPRADPAQVGLRGALARMGIRTKPSPKELALRKDIQLVSQHWPGPRAVAVANPKGSANKTPTTVCLSAIFARYGGGPVLAWDNNETRGTAAWRTQQGPHEATVLDLLPKVTQLLGVGAQAAELARHVHHQPADKFDVLWSDQSTEGEHEVTGDEVDAIYEVAAKYYRLICIDSGNSERASNWRSMIRHAHSLVVPCTNVEDTAEAGARMLEALSQRDPHSADLARNAVAIISQRTPGKDPRMRRIVRDFAPLVRTVVTIPHDPALYSGVIRFDALRSATQRAWLAAGAAVAEGL